MKRKLHFLTLLLMLSVGFVKAQDPFIGEIKMFAGTFAPVGYAFCDGQLLPIAQNTALFSLIGTTYGGDGQTTFALPDLRGRAPIHEGQGSGLTSRQLGSGGGTENNTLTVNQMPAHSHSLVAVSTAGNQNSPTNNLLGDTTAFDKEYSDASGNTTMNSSAIGNTGGGQQVNNMQPYRVINYIIALQGVYPSQN